jgi:myo-inositol-1(or 4)-monophosphatase
MPSPRKILATLLPHLQVAAAYAHEIQTRIVAQPSKDSDSLFASALTDADLSIQTFVEVLLLGLFPQTRFYGEEHASTYNTKYFRSIDLAPAGSPPNDYLLTLDPIDGTRFYMDGHPNYQIILGVLSSEAFEAVLVLNPAYQTMTYALRGEGAFQGSLQESLENCQPLQVTNPKNVIYLGGKMGRLAASLRDRYQVIDIHSDYSDAIAVPNFNRMLSGELCGAVMASGKFIDSAALAFIAQEAGCRLSQHNGSPMPPLHKCQNHEWPGLVIAATESVQTDLLAALKL